MKRFVIGAALVFLGATSALAADMALKAPPAATAPVWSWTGFYLGGEGGYDWGSANQSFTALGGGTTGNYKISGWEGGGTAGFNYQFDPHWVAGIEGDISGANIKGTILNPPNYGCGNLCISQVKWFDTFRGRLGYVVGNSVLLYGTGGLAYGSINTGAGPVLMSTLNRSGWTAGGGIEYGFAPHWSAKLEYLHVDFKTFMWTNTLGCTGLNCTTFDRFDVLRVGINYNFSGLH